MTFTVERLDANRRYGIVVKGLKEKDLADEGTRAELRRLWIEHGLINFKAEVTPSFHVALSQVFGKLEPHPVKEYQLKGNPELLSVLYDPEKTDQWRVDGKLLGAWLPWHHDLGYMEHNNHGGILRVKNLPSAGGETGFIDKIEAYDALPEKIKKRIDGLYVIYRMRIDPREQRYVALRNTVEMVRTHPRIEDVRVRQDRDYPPVVHPIVFQQPETGRKVLNVSPSMAESVYGLDPEESHELLYFLCMHVSNEDLAYYHSWSLDDMVLWDNWRMLHCARGVEPHEHREMWRTTIAGDYQLGRLLSDFERENPIRRAV